MAAPDTPGRLLARLPALYRSPEAGEDLPRLLAVFEELLFSGRRDAGWRGIEREATALPALFAPLGLDGDAASRTPAHFLPWIAGWLSFAPHELFDADALRRIVAGIVPLYDRRGTQEYLERLLALCFDEIEDVRVDADASGGLRLGHSRIGLDTLLAEERPFWFGVDVRLRRAPGAAARRLEQRLRAVIDFAKPAHTAYELHINAGPAAKST
jgi:phage tail-like protein